MTLTTMTSKIESYAIHNSISTQAELLHDVESVSVGISWLQNKRKITSMTHVNVLNVKLRSK